VLLSLLLAQNGHGGGRRRCPQLREEQTRAAGRASTSAFRSFGQGAISDSSPLTSGRSANQSEFIDSYPRLRQTQAASGLEYFQRLEFAESLVRDVAVQLTWQLPVHPEKRSQEDFEHRMQLRSYLWAGFLGETDRVENELQAFRSDTEILFRKIIKRKSE
jgi:hypothetical protein